MIPTALFYVVFLTIGTWAAYAAALGWAVGALVRRMRSGRRVPGILVLAVIGLAVCTALAVATESKFL